MDAPLGVCSVLAVVQKIGTTICPRARIIRRQGCGIVLYSHFHSKERSEQLNGGEFRQPLEHKGSRVATYTSISELEES